VAGRRFARAAAFGLATGLMNLAFYEAIAALPLGTAVAVEFCGPVAVAAVASRRPRDVAAVLLAAVGVLLIADVRWSAAPWGVVWALAAAAMWAAYILLGARGRHARQRRRRHGRGLRRRRQRCSRPALLLGNPGGVATLVDPAVLGLGLGVGVLSSVVPYVLDQVVLRRVGTARFAVLLALLPATATVVGLVLLASCPGRPRRPESRRSSRRSPFAPGTATRRRSPKSLRRVYRGDSVVRCRPGVTLQPLAVPATCAIAHVPSAWSGRAGRAGRRRWVNATPGQNHPVGRRDPAARRSATSVPTLTTNSGRETES
jgi:hypothetical protein